MAGKGFAEEMLMGRETFLNKGQENDGEQKEERETERERERERSLASLGKVLSSGHPYRGPEANVPPFKSRQHFER